MIKKEGTQMNMPQKVLILMHGRLPSKPTNGLAVSVIRRANALTKAGVDCEILVHTHYLDFDEELERLNLNKVLHPNVKVRYMWNELAGDSSSDLRIPRNIPIEEDGYVTLPDKARKNVYRSYRNGIYEKFKFYRDNGTISFIDYLQPNFTRDRREWHDMKGYVRKIDYMDPIKNTPVRTLHLNKRGSCYLSLAQSPSTNTINQVLWLNEHGQYNADFSNIDELLLYWLENMVLNDGEDTILISEYAFKFHILSKLKRKNIPVIYTFHNNHLEAPYTYGSPVRKEHVHFLNHQKEADGVVYLTNGQKEDIEKQFGSTENLFYVPHHAPKVEVKDQDRDFKKVVFIGRFAPVKNPTHAVMAFEKVIKQIPDARLELYGWGPEEDAIRKKIQQHNLSKNVEIMGLTEKSLEVFMNARLSVMPSDYEGMGLTMLESMSCGCPVISYDFNYGPQDLIKNDVNGVIINRGDIDSLAEKIIELLSDKERTSAMSLEARKITEQFSEERLISDWQHVFQTIKNRNNSSAEN